MTEWTPIRSALVVAVPAATPLVGAHRLRMDPAAAIGVPEHITLLYPFVLSRRLTAEFGIRPYEGDYGDEPEPHLTVAIGDAEGARGVEAEVAAGLPIRTVADRVLLMQGDTALWRVVEELVLS